jgi:DNA-binding transcriptional ArsR family regulator
VLLIRQNIRNIEYSYVTISSVMPDSLRRFKADIFQALAHPTRIAIIELLQNGELSAGELIEKLGMEQANVSQHLSVLRAKMIVANRKSGNQVFYSVRDPIIIEVLALMRRYFQRHLKETQGLLKEMDQSSEAAGSRSR